MTSLLSSAREAGHIVRKSTLSILAVCAIPLPGCIPVPLALPDPEPFTVERLTSIRIGQTTRDEVHALFSNWTYETDDGVQIAHLEPQMSEGGRYSVFALPRQLGDLGLVGLVIGGDGWCCLPGMVPLKGDNYEDFWVLFEFGHDSTVARLWIAGDRTPCAIGGACYHDSYLQIIADETLDAGTAASDRCVIYAYASDDFELPVTVTGHMRTGWLFEKTSFVRFDVAVGVATPSVWYENIPGSVVTMPVDCAGGEVHYVALRPRDGLIETVREEPSVGERAIDRRYLVERLVPVNASVRAEPSIWTNCTTADPCRELAILDTASEVYRTSAIVDAHEQSHEAVDHMLLRPGQYTVQFRLNSSVVDRHHTFDLEAGHRYHISYLSVPCSGPPRSYPGRLPLFGGKEAQTQLCNLPRVGESAATTTWIEDAATSRVVAGEKWCASDADCPASRCSLPPGEPRGVCKIPELQ